ncbi:mannose-1-phosphate guanylyltransferase [Intrasporangium oryzae NRRL B-24470]|uniref:Mannose-1-phosphate guanylyltransferase n=1 Tax=Intrasporangium oryzae NRRL B-24470 TaxID=1386089 RepID=W9G9A1_9MICO|nr:mannose-1-phosphate guanylyltransferase [Intrasporangium oryzae]EWT02771.1 mannose-1-phosphate guanylyltransferase [Intrasporangium oryzae NRRL B-24470]
MSEGEQIDGLWAVIPAGGAGTRLWPLSRQHSPKFLHDLTGSGQSLLRATWSRLEPLVGDRMLVVTGAAHEEAVRRQLPALPHDAVVAEPSPRDSMPAIGLAAAIIERRDPTAVLGSFAADHVVADTDAFRRAIAEAVAVARGGELVTIGIEPTHPATGFGYIRLGKALEVSDAPSARRVDEFVEKPDSATAAHYLSTGEYRWNAGMFVVGATRLLDLLATEHPEMVESLRAIADDPGRMVDLWPTLTKIAIDHAVAEPAAAAGLVAVVPAALGWDDIGDFASLGGLIDAADGTPGLKVLGEVGDVVAIGSTGLVSTSGRVVALVGVDDVVVVDTPDAVLVLARERAQDVKQVIAELTARQRTDLL